MTLPSSVILGDPTLPPDMAGVDNGKVPLPLLRAMPGATTGRYDHLAYHTLVPQFEAMAAAFLAERDRKLSFTGAYRSFAQQDALFRSRHRVDSAGRKHYAGLRWTLIPGMANANIPGTSNHGYGLALDLAIGTPQAFTSLTIPDTLWLISRAPDFGFFGENASEGWHWVLHPDRLPKPPEPSQEDVDMFTFYVPEGFYDLLAVGPKTFKVSSPDVARELVALGKVTNSVVNGQYDDAAIKVSVGLWADMAGFSPVSPR